jgi:acetyl CoA:N6-hydroxylysine acetyl transferase
MSPAANQFDPGTLPLRSEPAADGRTVTLRVATDADLELLHRWNNDPEVSEWWDLAGEPAVVREYLAEQEASLHTQSWIGLIDGKPFAFLETYLPAHDPFADSYPARATDRGFHVLVGDTAERGTGAARALLRLTVNGLFDDPPAQRVLCEPNVNNHRMLTYCQAMGGVIEGEVDLPGKRAAVVVWNAPIGPAADRS